VWAVERRENLLEDQSVLDEAKRGTASVAQLYHYYLGYLKDPSITSHIQPVPDASVPFAKRWGIAVAVDDLHRVIERARSLGGRVVLGGHSLGGGVVTAYATWNFAGRPGAAQAHLGAGITASGALRGWNGSGTRTPIRRYATMLSGAGVANADGSEWYFPARLTLDLAGVGNGTASPAQRVLGLRSTLGRRLPHALRIYGFGARLGGAQILAEIRRLARRPGSPPAT
jgi:hypothetical protein